MMDITSNNWCQIRCTLEYPKWFPSTVWPLRNRSHFQHADCLGFRISKWYFQCTHFFETLPFMLCIGPRNNFKWQYKIDFYPPGPSDYYWHEGLPILNIYTSICKSPSNVLLLHEKLYSNSFHTRINVGRRLLAILFRKDCPNMLFGPTPRYGSEIGIKQNIYAVLAIVNGIRYL